jgi:hypothetical protein
MVKQLYFSVYIAVIIWMLCGRGKRSVAGLAVALCSGCAMCSYPMRKSHVDDKAVSREKSGRSYGFEEHNYYPLL